jgi:hypothetical protein
VRLPIKQIALSDDEIRIVYRVKTVPFVEAGFLSLSAGAETTKRRFGGVGLMVQEPKVQLRVRESATWSAEGPQAERVLAFARDWSRQVHQERCFHITVECAPPQHVGLGSGTQLGLAIARILAEATGQNSPDPIELAGPLGGARGPPWECTALPAAAFWSREGSTTPRPSRRSWRAWTFPRTGPFYCWFLVGSKEGTVSRKPGLSSSWPGRAAALAEQGFGQTEELDPEKL